VIGLARRRGLDDAWLLVVMAAELAVLAIFFPTTRLLAQFSAMQMVYAGHALSAGRWSAVRDPRAAIRKSIIQEPRTADSARVQRFLARMIQTSARESSGPPS
jgi:hypothetical protein